MLVCAAAAAGLPLPGSPRTLTDWRWLARPDPGSRHVVSDPWGKKELPAVDDGHRLLEVGGPGVLDHLWTVGGKGPVTISADGRELWSGELHELTKDPPRDGDETPLFPKPVCFGAAGMLHLLAPIGFRYSLELRVARPRFPHFLSYRTFPEGTDVFPADPGRESEYADGLREAARVWREGGNGFYSCLPESADEQVREFTLPAQARRLVFESGGPGELLRLEFHVNPALVGSLRDVVAELTYDGSREPSLRLPLTDLAGVPHPWAIHRWHAYNGSLAAGIRYPWQVNRPRFHYPEATCLLNLPVPYVDGLRIELLNRSPDVRFTGFVKAWVQSLTPDEAAAAGRLCGTRTFMPIEAGVGPQPLIGAPGPGRLVGLGLFTSGGSRHSAAVRNSVSSLAVDGGDPITGHGLLPLWFQGIYGGPSGGTPVWNHPGFCDRYGSVMRHFVTDPIPFEDEATFAFTPGPDAPDLPTQAITVALWYRFAAEPYVAPVLPERAEALPHSDFGLSSLHMHRERPQLSWLAEAEDLVPMASAGGCHVRAVEDGDHNYHPSRGKYLQVAADRPGDYVDCLVPFPEARYVRIGLVTLWGPGLGDFEIDVLSRQQAAGAPRFEQGGEFYTGRAIGAVPMKAPILMGHSLQHRRDTGVEYSVPFANPAPDSSGILRFVCRGKPLTSNSHLMRLDQVCLKTPPPTESGWREFECGVMPELAPAHLLEHRVPKYGRTDWSGWGAVLLSGREGGTARFRAALPVGPSTPTALVVRGCLGPKQGAWQVQVLGNAEPPAALTPGKDDRQVTEWTVPVGGVTLPGFVELEVECRGAAEKGPRARVAPPAKLALDAWTMR